MADLQSANRIERVKQASAEASNALSRPDDKTAQPDRRLADTANLGERIRGVRLSKGLSLKELAAQAGLSRAFVTQIERNQTSPSVASISRIAKVLGVTLSELFAAAHNAEGLVRQEERIRITYAGNKYFDEVLSPSVSGRLLVLFCTIEPGADSGHELYAHDADEECVIVMQGTLEVVVEGNVFNLGPGDALTLSSRRQHGFRNAGTEEVQAFWVMTPARF
jgi:transcriptional regulator with XRE-family HTH domain